MSGIIDSRYLLFMMAALAITMLFSWLGENRGENIEYLVVGTGFVFSVLYVHFVVIKLPIFNKFYIRNSWYEKNEHYSPANHKAAGIMTGLVTGFSLLVILYFLDVKNPGYHAFLAGVSAVVISLYYETKTR